jgi:4-amino-4-deoxy-L-arabinose transferase-like glycosyltransferase
MKEPGRLRGIDPRTWLWIILAVALAVRLATAIWLGDEMEVVDAGGTHDQVSYDMLAHRLATGHGFTFPTRWYPWVKADTPTSYYSGTMVLHLAIVYKVFGYHPLIARVLYAVLGAGIVYLVYRLGRRLFGETSGLVAGALAAGYAYLILYSATLLTETPFILFLLLSLDAAYEVLDENTRRHRIVLGLALAGAVLFRMAVIPFVMVLLAWLYLAARRSLRPVKLIQLLLPVGIIVLAVLPWTVRNYALYGRFMLLESQFGHVFWNSNHPDRGTDFGDVGWTASIPAELSNLNEADLTYELLRRGRQFVLDDPKRFMLLTLSRAKLFFTFWPTANSSLISNVARALSFGILLPFMLYGLILSADRWRLCLPLYAFLVIHLGVYLSSWVMIRYRVPADTVLLVFAAFGVLDLVRRVPILSRMTQDPKAIHC